MAVEELRGWLIALIVLLVVNLVRSFFPAYVGRKGQNLADKEDIAAITREVERVKSQYTLIAERFKAGNQLRFAALDKRLQAHQDAYGLWRNLVSVAQLGQEGREQFRALNTECNIFWERNCLFLEPEAREAFDKAHSAAAQYTFLVDSPRVPTEERLSRIIADMQQCGEALIRAVQLPGLLGLDSKAKDQGKNSL